MQEQILPLAAFCKCFWEATCLEGKVDTNVSEDWQNNLRAQLVRGEDGCGKPEDCRFSFQRDTSLEKQIWSFIKINSVYSLLSVLNTVPIMKLILCRNVALVCTTVQGWPCVWGQGGAVVGKSSCWIISIWEEANQQQLCWYITRWFKSTSTTHPTKCKKRRWEAVASQSCKPLSCFCNFGMDMDSIRIQMVPAVQVICWISSALVPILSPLQLGSPRDPPPLELYDSLVHGQYSACIFWFLPGDGFSPTLSLYGDNSLLLHHGGSCFLTSGMCRSHSS